MSCFRLDSKEEIKTEEFTHFFGLDYFIRFSSVLS